MVGFAVLVGFGISVIGFGFSKIYGKPANRYRLSVFKKIQKK
jgi:hypothetical protein